MSAPAGEKRLANRLLRHAAWVSPVHRKDWASGMMHELKHIRRDSQALEWAAGCVVASYRERMQAMIRIQKLPLWLIALEMAVCLVPLNWLFLAVFANAAHGIMPLKDFIRFGSVAAAGPLGLLLAVRMLFFSRRRVGRNTMILTALLAAWTLFAYLAELLHNGAVPFPWREYVLIALLPAVAVAHLICLNGARRRSPETA
jgi:hypothetical protein